MSEDPVMQNRIAAVIDGCSGSTRDMAIAIRRLEQLGLDRGEASATLCEVIDAGVNYRAWLRRQRRLV